MNTTNIIKTAVAAFQMVNEAFQKYRKRVIDEYGEETDYLFRTGQKVEEIVTKTRDENGKKVKTVEFIFHNFGK